VFTSMLPWGIFVTKNVYVNYLQNKQAGNVLGIVDAVVDPMLVVTCNDMAMIITSLTDSA
jgi:hypothetical protein